MAVHLRASPADRAIRELDDWQIGLIHETVMNYPVEGVRRCYFDQKKSVSNFDDEDLPDMGYTAEEIAQIKGSA